MALSRFRALFTKLHFFHSLTKAKNYQLRVQMWDIFGEFGQITYDTFKVTSSQDGFRLVLGKAKIVGMLSDSWGEFHNGSRFSTQDSDKDAEPSENCARQLKSAGWLFDCNPAVNLFGYNIKKGNSGSKGIFWRTFGGSESSLARVEVSMRPSDYESVRKI